MKKIRSSKKGFTLAELLIVVAIIGVLVGISIPIFTTQLEKSREATDIANLRAAKAAATADYLDKGVSATYKYDADLGKLVAADATVAGYGKGTTAGIGGTGNSYKVSENYTYTSTENAAGKVIQVKITVDNTSGEAAFEFSWV